MTALVTQRFHKLSNSLVELKVKVREAMATELATAVGSAVRDIVIVTMIDRIVNIPTRTVTTPSQASWRDDRHDRWGALNGPWAEADNDVRPRVASRGGLEERDDENRMTTVPTTAAIAVGVNVGRW